MKDLNQTIASRHYLATDAQVRELATLNYESGEQAVATRGTFLRVELAALQAAVMGAPKLRAGGKAQQLEKDAVLAALKEVHARLYSIVLEAITTDDIADGPKLRKAEKTRRALERNRRSNFARSAKATLMAYVRCGGNVSTLAVPQVTKAMLQAEIAKRKPQPDASEQAERIANRMAAQIERIKEEDQELAQAVSQRLVSALAATTTDKTTKSPAKAVEENIPLQVGESYFIPVSPTLLSEIKPEQRTAH